MDKSEERMEKCVFADCKGHTLQAENEKLRKIIVREVDVGSAEVDDIGIDAWIEQALKEG